MKKFSTSFNGYNKDEVNEFVSDVTKNFEEMLNRLKQTDKELELLRQENIKYQNLESTLNKAIILANDTANQIKRTSRDEAEMILNDARKNASRIINDALLKAEKAENDARDLQRRVEIYKKRVKQVIEEQRELIDNIDKVEY